MTGPDRAFIAWPHINGAGLAFKTDNGHRTEYIRRDPAVLAALPEVQALIAAAYEVAARETLTLVLASVTDIASTLLSVGDAEGANGLCVMIKTLEQHADTIPKSVSGALTPAAAAAALAARDAAMRAEGLREAAEVAFGVTPYKRVRGEAGYSDLMCARSDGTWQNRKETQAAILARAAGIEKDGK